MTSGVYDMNMRNNIQAFNRHFCPEIFTLETITNDDTVVVEQNQYWYGISDERLNKLLSYP